MVTHDTGPDAGSPLEKLQREIDALRRDRDRFVTELERIERELVAAQASAIPDVRRLLRWYDRRSDELVGSAPLQHIELPALQRIFGLAADDPMYNAYPVTAREASQLQAYVDVPLQLDRHDYFIEADAISLHRAGHR